MSLSADAHSRFCGCEENKLREENKLLHEEIENLKHTLAASGITYSEMITSLQRRLKKALKDGK